MMEGISAEAASIAGHLKLSNLCWIYDNNHITIEGNTDLAFDEDVAARFAGYGWDVSHVHDANDLVALANAYNHALSVNDRPKLIIVDSHIGYGSPHRQDTRKRTAKRWRRRSQTDEARLRLAGRRQVPGARRRARKLPRRHGQARARN